MIGLSLISSNLQNAELRIRQLEESLLDRNEELDKVRKQLREEKQKILNVEAHWRAQLESERQDADVKYDGQVSNISFLQLKRKISIRKIASLLVFI